MRSALFFIIASFSIITWGVSAPFSAASGVKIIRGAEPEKPESQLIDIIQEKKEPEKKEKTKEELVKEQIEEIPTLPAIQHCLKLEDSLTEHYLLVDNYNSPLKIHLGATLPDFGFIIPQYWVVTERAPRVKFNAIMSLKLSEQLGFKYGGYKFQGNCQATIDGEIKKQDNFSFVEISMPLAFDTTEAKLTYVLARQDGYNWLVGDILVNSESLVKRYRKEITDNIQAEGIDKAIIDLCKTSNFPTLECE